MGTNVLKQSVKVNMPDMNFLDMRFGKCEY